MLTGFIRDTVRVYGCSIGALIIGIACWVILCYNSNPIGDHRKPVAEASGN